MTRGWKDPITGVPVLSSAGTIWDITSSPLKPEIDHIVCCRPDISLCGKQVGHETLRYSPEPAKDAQNPCPECWNKAADNARCPEPGCPGNDRPD
jgi:hypothetical protein